MRIPKFYLIQFYSILFKFHPIQFLISVALSESRKSLPLYKATLQDTTSQSTSYSRPTTASTYQPLVATPNYKQPYPSTFFYPSTKLTYPSYIIITTFLSTLPLFPILPLPLYSIEALLPLLPPHHSFLSSLLLLPLTFLPTPPIPLLTKKR